MSGADGYASAEGPGEGANREEEHCASFETMRHPHAFSNQNMKDLQSRATDQVCRKQCATGTHGVCRALSASIACSGRDLLFSVPAVRPGGRTAWVGTSSTDVRLHVQGGRSGQEKHRQDQFHEDQSTLQQRYKGCAGKTRTRPRGSIQWLRLHLLFVRLERGCLLKQSRRWRNTTLYTPLRTWSMLKCSSLKMSSELSMITSPKMPRVVPFFVEHRAFDILSPCASCCWGTCICVRKP